MVTRYKNLNEEVQAAQETIDSWCEPRPFSHIIGSELEKEWLQKVLDILKLEKYVTVYKKRWYQD